MAIVIAPPNNSSQRAWLAWNFDFLVLNGRMRKTTCQVSGNEGMIRAIDDDDDGAEPAVYVMSWLSRVQTRHQEGWSSQRIIWFPEVRLGARLAIIRLKIMRSVVWIEYLMEGIFYYVFIFVLVCWIFV